MGSDLNILGLCRRANKLSMGHDACKDSVRTKKACLCLISKESSDRVFDEFLNLCKQYDVPVERLNLTIKEINRITGYKAGILTVNDPGFAGSVMKSINKTTFAEVEAYDK